MLDEAARKYLGVPFRHLGRDRNGLDCVGLCLVSARDLGIDIPEPEPYERGPTNGSLLERLRSIDCLMEHGVADMKPGDIAAFHVGPYVGHVGIVSFHPEYKVLSIIHAFLLRRKVVEEPLDSFLDYEKPIALFRLRGR